MWGKNFFEKKHVITTITIGNKGFHVWHENDRRKLKNDLIQKTNNNLIFKKKIKRKKKNQFKKKRLEKGKKSNHIS